MVSIGNKILKIAAGVGHANTSGGDPYELSRNRQVMAELITLVEASDGFELYCWTPNQGQGTFPGPLDMAAAQVRAKVTQGWLPHLVTEIHHQGLANPTLRGGFTIYPAAGGLVGRNASGIVDFVDKDVQAAAPSMSKVLTAKIGVPVWGSGSMSEKATGVGSKGWRLGFFGAVSDSYFANNACVFITEAATFTNPQDRVVMDSPGFARNEAQGLLEAYALLAKSRMGWTYNYRIGGGSATPAPTGFTKGDSVAVVTPGNLQSGPEYPNEVTRLTEGTTGTIVDGPRVYGGSVWWDIKGSFGSGWIVEGSLRPAVVVPEQPTPGKDYIIPELDQYEDTPIAVTPAEVYFTKDNNQYQAVFVGDRVRATKSTPRYRTLALDPKELNGVNVPSGTEFDVKWLVSRVSGGSSVYRTPWRTFIRVEDTERIGDTYVDFRKG